MDRNQRMNHETRVTSTMKLHVGSLELIGFPPARRFAIADAFVRQLEHMLRERSVESLPSCAKASARTSIEIASNASPREIGSAIARAIYRSLGELP